MIDCVGPLGVKRLKPEHRRHIPGVIGYCRTVFEQQVPFDHEFRMDDTALYCVEMTEKAFRSRGLALSEPVRIGDWERLGHYPLTALAIPQVSSLMLEHPITLEQPVYVPGNERQGIWASPLLEKVFGPEPNGDDDIARGRSDGLSLRGDLEMAKFAAYELRRSYSDLPVRLIGDFAQRPWVQGLLRGPRSRRMTGSTACFAGRQSASDRRSGARCVRAASAHGPYAGLERLRPTGRHRISAFRAFRSLGLIGHTPEHARCFLEDLSDWPCLPTTLGSRIAERSRSFAGNVAVNDPNTLSQSDR